MKKLVIIFFLAFLFLRIASAQDFTYIISNSEDWRDVYSSIIYASFEGVGSDFLVSTAHGNILLNGISKGNKIRVLSSSDNPFVFNYPDTIKSKGFAGVDEINAKNLNLELIKSLSDINNFVIVGNSYGYNAIAVAPYAIKSKSWVFFADRANIAEIDSIISSRNAKKIIIYGTLDREVKNTLAKYTPQIIDNGDKFKDNIDITKEYLKINPTKQLILTNGEFIEKEIMSGTEPILFTGKENVPEQIADYLKNSDFEVGVLIGNELVGAATNIRRTTGISVIVKFARSSRIPAGGVSVVEGLDLFYLPTPTLKLDLYSVKYNRASSQLEVTYKSESNVPAYFKGTISLIYENEKKKVGDIEPIFIAQNSFKTVTYSGLNINSDSIEAEVYTLYGETTISLDMILQKTLKVDIVNVIDQCNIDVESIKYSKQKKSFILKVNNKAYVECWANAELSNLIIEGTKSTIGSEGAVKISPKKSQDIVIKQEMSDEDLGKNSFVDVIVNYGEKEDSLVKMFKGRFELKIESLSILTYAIIALAIAILVLIIIIIILKRREKNYDS